MDGRSVRGKVEAGTRINDSRGGGVSLRDMVASIVHDESVSTARAIADQRVHAGAAGQDVGGGVARGSPGSRTRQDQVIKKCITGRLTTRQSLCCCQQVIAGASLNRIHAGCGLRDSIARVGAKVEGVVAAAAGQCIIEAAGVAVGNDVGTYTTRGGETV